MSLTNLSTSTIVNLFINSPPILKLMVLIPVVLTIFIILSAILNLLFRLFGVDLDDIEELLMKAWKKIRKIPGRIYSTNGKYMAKPEPKGKH